MTTKFVAALAFVFLAAGCSSADAPSSGYPKGCRVVVGSDSACAKAHVTETSAVECEMTPIATSTPGIEAMEAPILEGCTSPKLSATSNVAGYCCKPR